MGNPSSHAFLLVFFIVGYAIIFLPYDYAKQLIIKAWRGIAIAFAFVLMLTSLSAYREDDINHDDVRR